MRLILSILAVVVFVVIVIAIIASGNSHNAGSKLINLDSYNKPGTSVTQITTGQLTADENRQAIKIIITQNSRSIYLLSGYEQHIASSETYYNNSASYSTFLGALQNARFTFSRPTSQANMFGVCPLGSTFQYQSNNSEKTTSNLWSTSCSYNDGTFAGNGPLIRQLFSLQIPNYNAFTNTYPTINDPTYQQ